MINRLIKEYFLNQVTKTNKYFVPFITFISGFKNQIIIFDIFKGDWQ